MSLRACARGAAALILWPAPAAARRAPRLPDPQQVLERAASPDVSAYVGRVTVTIAAPKAVAPRQLAVRFQAPNRYRREVLDDAGKPAIVVVSDGKTEWVYDKSRDQVWVGEASDPDARQLGFRDQLDLIQSNYEVVVTTGAKVARRLTWGVDIRSRGEGKLLRRLWVDRKNGMVLRSQLFLPDGSLASMISFDKVTFDRAPRESAFAFKMPRSAKVTKRLQPDYLSLDQAKQASGMDPRLPGWLPSGFVFESLDVLPRGGKNIIHYRFSDGMNVVSLFQCPPHVRLEFGLKSGQTVTLASGTGTLAWTEEGQVLGWSSGSSKFVLVGPVGVDALKKIADSVR